MADAATSPKEGALRIRGEIHEDGDEAPITIAEGKFYPHPARRPEGAPANGA